MTNRTVYGNTMKVFAAALFFIAAFSALADYPIMSHHYAADPTAVEWNGRIYAYCSNDEENDDNNYLMDSIVCFSTDDLKNWTDHGIVFDSDELSSWYSGTAWAPCIVLKDNQFYLYYGDAYWGISVVTSSSPTGPFTAPENELVVKRSSLSGGTPGADSEWLFDPGVFVDDDGSVHLLFGGAGADQARYIELETNMHDAIGSAVMISFPDFFEASHMHKYNGVYYYSYADNYNSDYTNPTPTPGSQIGYMTSSSPTGPFTYRGVVLGEPPTNFGNNNHHTLFTYQGNWYCIYHNRYQADLDGVATGTHRNICLDRMYYNPDGTIQQVVCTQDGLTQLKNFDPYVQVEAETLAAQSGVRSQSCSEGGMNITEISNGDWIRVRGVNFQYGVGMFFARVASTNANSSIELRLDSLTGTLIGTCNVPNTGGEQTWTPATCAVSNASGIHDLYLIFRGTDGSNLFNFNNWRFGISNDFAPPEPNVMTWASLPSSAGRTSITMTATTATDDSPPVQYYFECITDGNASSTWQTDTTYVATGLTTDTSYTFMVKARDSSIAQNETQYSSPASATPLDLPPAAPTNLTVLAGNETILLEWDENTEDDFAGCNIYRSTTSGGGYSKLNGTLLLTPTYTDNNVTNEVTYYYVVTAVDDANNESGFSNEAAAKPRLPDRIYNFDGITAADSNHNAYYCDVDVFPFYASSANRNSFVEATDAQYAAIAALDSQRWTTSDPGSGDEVLIWVEMKIEEPVEEIGRIELSFVGNTAGSGSVSHSLYVLKAGADWTQNDSWVLLGTTDITAGVDGELTGCIGPDIQTYIDGSGKITWGVTESVSSESVSVNYLEAALYSVVPNYQTCAEVQAGGYGLVSDLTDDCYVNLDDLDIIAGYWLNINCDTNDDCDGADFIPVDGDVDFEDFSDFAVDWMLCNNPADSNCIVNW